MAASAEPWNERRLRPSRPTWRTVSTQPGDDPTSAISAGAQRTDGAGIPAEPVGRCACTFGRTAGAQPPCGLPLLRAVQAKQEWCAPTGFPANGTRHEWGNERRVPDRDLGSMRVSTPGCGPCPEMSDESGYHRVNCYQLTGHGAQQFTASRACLDRKSKIFTRGGGQVRRVVQELLGKRFERLGLCLCLGLSHGVTAPIDGGHRLDCGGPGLPQRVVLRVIFAQPQLAPRAAGTGIEDEERPRRSAASSAQAP